MFRPRAQRETRTNDVDVSAAPDPLARDFTRVPAHGQAPIRVWPKLTVGAVNDPAEHEADRIADEVLRMPEQGMQSHGREDRVLPKSAPSIRVQTKSTGSGDSGGIEAPPIVHDVLTSHGQPLDAATRSFFEPRFGRDFSRVRVHDDATGSTQAIGALAYTLGSQIVFGPGRYRPDAREGRKLLAHELTHVAQQSHEDSGTYRLRRQVDDGANAGDSSDDPIMKALLAAVHTHFKAPASRAWPRDSAALKSAVLGLQLPADHKISAVPKQQGNHDTEFPKLNLGKYPLGFGDMPEIPKNIEKLKESKPDEKMDRELNLLGSYDSDTGEIGAGIELKTPLTPLLQSIKKQLRKLRQMLKQ